MVVEWVLAGLALASGLGAIRFGRAYQVDREVRRALPPADQTPGEGRAARGLAGGGTAGGLSALEQVEDLSRLDPDFMDAFTRAMGDGSIDSAGEVAALAERYLADPGSRGYTIMANRLRGFAGEERVERILSEQGYDAALHGATNQAGTDIMVDGAAWQIKTTINPRVIEHHFDRYPLDNVIAPMELRETLGDAPGIMYVPGFSYTEIAADQAQTLAAAGDAVSATDGALTIPIVSVAFAGFRAWRQYETTNLTLLRATEGFAIDAALLTAGIWTGKVGGMAAGVSTGLPGMETVGAIGGAAAGGIAARFASNRLKDTRIILYRTQFGRTSKTLGGLMLERAVSVPAEPYPALAVRTQVDQVKALEERAYSPLRELLWPSFRGQLARRLAENAQTTLEKTRTAVAEVQRLANRLRSTGDAQGLGLLAIANPWLLESADEETRAVLQNGLEIRAKIARELFLRSPAKAKPTKRREVKRTPETA